MKKSLLIIVFILTRLIAEACPVCEARQPKVLRGITHGQGPENNWDYLIISVVGAIVILTLFFSVKWLISPGEKSESHIKRTIINWQ